MAALLSPSRATSQPQQATQIDWGNPIARGLVFAAIPGGPELISGVFPQRLGGASIGVNEQGRSFATTSTTADGWFWPISANHPLYSITTADTLFVLMSRVSGAGFGNVFGVPYRTTTWATPFYAWGLSTQSNTTTGTVSVATSSSARAQANSTVGMFVNGAAPRAQGHVRGATSVKYYSGGAQFSTETAIAAVSPDFTNKQPPVLFNRSNSLPGEGMAAQAGIVLVWNRELSATEWKSLSDNPWQLIKTGSSRRVFAVVAEAPTADAVLSAAWSEENESQAASAQVDVRAALAQAEQGEVHQSAVAVQASAAITQAEQGDTHQVGAAVQTNAAIAQVEQGDTHAVASAASVRASAAWVESNDAQQAVIAVGSGAMLSAAWVEQSEAQAVAGQIRVNAAPSWTEQPEGFSLGGLVRVSATAGWIEKSEAHAIIGTVAIPAGAEDIDPYSVPLSRWVVFEGSKRVVVFEGSRRVVRFEGSDNEAGF